MKAKKINGKVAPVATKAEKPGKSVNGQKAPQAGKQKNNGLEKVRKGKMIASLQRHDQFFSKQSATIEKLFKAGKKKSEIAKQLEKECGGKKQADHMVFYSLNRLGLIHTKNDGELVKRHEALRKELKNGKTSS